MEAFQQAIAERVAEQHRHTESRSSFGGLGRAIGDDRHRVYLTVSEHAGGSDAHHFNGVVAGKGGAHHRVLHAYEVEISRMKWLTMCSLVACLALMMIFFPDALRIVSLGVEMKLRVPSWSQSFCCGDACFQPGVFHVLQHS